MAHHAAQQVFGSIKNVLSIPKPPKASGFEGFRQRQSGQQSYPQDSQIRPQSKQTDRDYRSAPYIQDEQGRIQSIQADRDLRSPSYASQEQMRVQPVQGDRNHGTLPYPEDEDIVLQPGPVDKDLARRTHPYDEQNPFQAEQGIGTPRRLSYLEDEDARLPPRHTERGSRDMSHPQDSQMRLRPEQVGKLRDLEDLIRCTFDRPPQSDKAFIAAAKSICVQVSTILKLENVKQTSRLNSQRQEVINEMSETHRVEMQDAIKNAEWNIKQMTKDLNGLRADKSTLLKQADQDSREIERLKKKTDLKQLKLDLSDARNQAANLKAMVETQKGTIAARDKTAGQLQRDLTTATRKIENTAALHTAELAQKDRDANVKLEAQKKSYAEQLNRADEDLRTAQDALTKQQNAHEQRIKTLKDEHSRSIEKQRTKHDDELQQRQTALEAVKSQARHNTQQMTTEHTAKISQLSKDHKAELTHMEEEMKKLAETLAKRHDDETREMRKEIQEINEILLTRDHEVYLASLFSTSELPRKPDDKIKESFTQIQKMVEDLAHTSWKLNPDLWTQQELRRASGQHVERLVKKAIVQDMIWTSLFRFLFCSPFRVLGPAGEQFEVEWKKECGEDAEYENKHYSWPTPSLTTERWRYMTLKGCHEVLSKPVPSSRDPRAAVKIGFKQNLESMTEAVLTDLEMVLDVTQSVETAVSKLCKAAAIAWLDLEMHRCRIVVQLPGNTHTSTADKIVQLQEEGLKLTVNPKVGRHGNAKGAELHTFSVIRGCSGEILSIP